MTTALKWKYKQFVLIILNLLLSLIDGVVRCKILYNLFGNGIKILRYVCSDMN